MPSEIKDPSRPVQEAASFEQAIRWVAYGLPPLPERWEQLHGYPMVIQKGDGDFERHTQSVLSDEMSIVDDVVIKEAMRKIVLSAALGHLECTYVPFVLEYAGSTFEGPIWKNSEESVPLGREAWSLSSISWHDWYGGCIDLHINARRFKLGIVFSFNELRAVFPVPLSAVPSLVVAAHTPPADGQPVRVTPGPKGKKTQDAFALCAAWALHEGVNFTGDDFVQQHFVEDVQKFWNRVFGDNCPDEKLFRQGVRAIKQYLVAIDDAERKAGD